ncbi:MAG: agmatine deiminase family protein [bacterium]|nr:agmatine deiminase family protein [bacterium]
MTKESKYRLPAEWEEQEAIILSWPHNLGTWPQEQLALVEQTYCALISEITEYQQVWLNVRHEQEKQRIQEMLQFGAADFSNLVFHINPTHDVWVRDYGPLYVLNENKSVRQIAKFKFNGWGNKYEEAFLNDNEIPYYYAKYTDAEINDAGHVLEGGSIDVNGQGLLLTSTDCLLNENREHVLEQTSLEEILKEHLGVQKVIWASGQIKGDDTDGHIDDAARFVAANKVVCISEDNKNDENYDGICQLKESLKGMTDQNGDPIEVVYVPMPDPVYYNEERLPASYANFLITNKKVLVPIYNCDKDGQALDVISSCFPGRQTIGIDCTTLVQGFGSIHCVSMQVPALGVGGKA